MFMIELHVFEIIFGREIQMHAEFNFATCYVLGAMCAHNIPNYNCIFMSIYWSSGNLFSLVKLSKKIKGFYELKKNNIF